MDDLSRWIKKAYKLNNKIDYYFDKENASFKYSKHKRYNNKIIKLLAKQHRLIDKIDGERTLRFVIYRLYNND